MQLLRQYGCALAAILPLMCGAAAAQGVPQAPAGATLEKASLPSLDGTALTAWVFRPAGAAAVRGAVVALHGCGGLYASRGRRAGELNARHQAMAELLLGEGYAVVFPDSLTPRGETELCTQRIGSRKIDQTQRRADALGALAWVARQPWADAGRLALLGWSHGGSAVLSATDATRAEVRAQAAVPRVAVAFYPGCSAPLKAGWKPSTTVALMLGEKDDWTPPAPCVELGRANALEVNVYPDSYHDFDNPSGSVRLRQDVPNGLNPGQGVHVGPNPAAREAAYTRLKALLRTRLD